MLPLKVKFNLSSFIIAHKDGSRETFDISLADAYASLKDGDIVAYSNLGKPYQDTPFMSWAPSLLMPITYTMLARSSVSYLKSTRWPLGAYRLSKLCWLSHSTVTFQLPGVTVWTI